MAKATDGQTMHKVRVVVPPREGHPGTWAAGRLWTPDMASEEQDVTDEQLAILAARNGIVVLQNGKPVKATAAPASRIHNAQLTAEEMQLVEDHRARRNDGGQQAQGRPGIQVKATGESAEDATARALAEANVGGITAQTPLDNREILMGQQQAGGHGFTGDATSGKQRPDNDELTKQVVKKK